MCWLNQSNLYQLQLASIQLCDTDGHELMITRLMVTSINAKEQIFPTLLPLCSCNVTWFSHICDLFPACYRMLLTQPRIDRGGIGAMAGPVMDSIRSNVTGSNSIMHHPPLIVNSSSGKGPILQYHDWVDQAQS
jgi:hypothetical protein